MPAQGKHRRSKQHHALTRKLALAGTGSAALALPLIGATTAGAAEVAVAPTTYAVVSGDTLSKIAAEHSIGGGWQKLYEANKGIVGADPSAIRPGLKLNLTAVAPAAAPAAAKASTGYANNLDGWIRESLDVMAQHGIPGSYDGIHRNIMRESSGNPLAINNWDSNAAAGIPSKGLLQVIDPTFKAYHVPGTPMDSYDPVANITAACNYAAARYGSIDNVNGAY
ncbi:transglycosylase SLT domain-containing protein [Streptomyces sp. NPDC099050]|uniref:transglycosylase SLT domain-containing protein n=1 Tax=Streptomyces sp. NPDC099050 TaxID=3366100 RepID=UPI0037FB929A